MRLREMRNIVRLRRLELNATRRRLSGCLTVDHLRRAGRRRTPRSVFDYVHGAADEELTAAELRDAVAADPGLTTADPELWFQLYILKDRSRAFALVDRAWSAGFRVLAATVASVALKPAYWYRLLSGPALGYANFTEPGPSRLHETAGFFDPGIDWADIRALRERWPGRIPVKGPLGPADARRAVDLGVDGLQLS